MLDFTLIINHQLFSDYYLGQILNRVTKKADRSREKAWQQLIALYERNRFENEDRLLARTGRFYDKIFEVMGFALDDPKTVELEEHAFEFSRTLYHEGKLISAIVYMPYGYSYDKKRREGKHFRPSYQNTLKEAIEELGLGWGIITNGETIRLIKAGSGKAYLEFRIADMCRYGTPDIYEQAFSVFFDLLAQEHLHSGYLDIVYEESKKHGTQVSDTLKDAILESIELFARGILHNPKNVPLLNMPDDIGTLFDESIIFMYRMLFVLYAEAHNLLPVADNRIYKENYSLDRLVDKIRLAGYTPDRNSSELWQSLKALFKILEKGINHRGCAIAALNGELNSSKEHPLLAQVELNDEIMADIIRRLTLTQVKGGGLDRISYRELDVAQLGSVYEGLLEYEPKIAEANLTIEKIKGNDQLIRAKADDKVAIREGEFYLSLWGGSRKGSGSYYTPKELTTFLVEKTLEPLVKNRKSYEVLELRIIDTAMGSGAFLVAAINYLARVYGQKLIDEGIDEDGIMDDEEFMQYKRLIAEHCIYGVDLKPTAVELAKLSIWLTTFAKDRPLTFLDHRLRAGNSLVGAWLDRTEEFSAPRTIKGKKLNSLYFVSKEALSPSKLHDKAYIAQLKEVQKENQESHIPAIVNLQSSNLLEQDIDLGFIESLVRHRIVDLSSDELNAEDVHIKARIFEAEREIGSEFDRLKTYMDLTCAVWFWDTDKILPPSSIELYDIRKHLFGEEVYFGTSVERITEVLVESGRISQEQRFFHWELEFPELYFDEEAKRLANSGFDAIIGNPPWDIVKVVEEDFYKKYQIELADASKSIINDIANKEWAAFQLVTENFAKYIKSLDKKSILSGRLDLYRIFLYQTNEILKTKGKFGLIFPASYYVDQHNDKLRLLHLDEYSISFLISFRNKNGIFKDVHKDYKFVALCATKIPAYPGFSFPIKFEVTSVENLPKIIHESITFNKEIIKTFAPVTMAFNEFFEQEKMNVTYKIYRDSDLFGDLIDDGRLNDLFVQLDMTQHKYLFESVIEVDDSHLYAKLYEGKNFWLYDSDFDPVGYLIKKNDAAHTVSAKLRKVKYHLEDIDRPLLSIREVTGSSNQRTLICSINPGNGVYGNTANVSFINADSFVLISILNSFVIDFIARSKVNQHMTQSVLKSLPIKALKEHDDFYNALNIRSIFLVCSRDEFAELWNESISKINYTNINTIHAPLKYPSLVDFANCNDMWDKSAILEGKTDTANRFDIGDRAQLRAEIDAIVAHLYGLNRDEMSYILDTFTALSNAETREFGEFRSKRMVLEEMKRLEGCQL